jgi:hypothetical protein
MYIQEGDFKKKLRELSRDSIRRTKLLLGCNFNLGITWAFGRCLSGTKKKNLEMSEKLYEQLLSYFSGSDGPDGASVSG